MSSKLFLLSALILSALHSKGQAYHPFPSANTIWGEAYSRRADSNFRIVYHGLKNQDTVINGKTYHKLYQSPDTVFQEAEYIGGLREDSAARKVYFYGIAPGYSTSINEDILIFDFSLNQGDTLKANANGGRNAWRINSALIVSNVDSVLLDGSYRKRMTLNFPVPSVWVEGVGNIVRGLFFGPGTYPNNGMWNELVCMQQHNDWFYHLNNSWIYPPHVYPSCVNLLLNNVPSQGIEKLVPENGGVKLYPNPVNGSSRLTITEAGKYETLEFFSAVGIRLRSILPGMKTDLTVDRKDFIPGLYIYRLTAKNGTYVSGRFTVE